LIVLELAPKLGFRSLIFGGAEDIEGEVLQGWAL
jgi:hypothetical protein